MAASPRCWQSAFGPQGLGTHGFIGTIGATKRFQSGDLVTDCYLGLRRSALTRSGNTTEERITLVVDLTTADRIVVYSVAASVLAASARARIFAFLIDARFLLRAFRAHDALRPTIRRGPNEIGQARANGVVVELSTFAV